MTKEEKNLIIDNLTEQVNKASHLYLTDTSGLNAEQTGKLRRTCFNENVTLIVAKNKLLQKAFDKSDKKLEGLYSVLKGSTAVMFTETGNVPAKLIKDFRKKNQKPVLKGAFVEEDFYIGDNQLENLVSIKSRNELIADVIAMLQTPVKNVISSLQSGQNTLHGVLETLSKK
jgi:large subunit ribosomal protein L10